MNTLLKVVLGVVAAVALLFLALIVVVALVLEPNDYRPYIVDAVEQNTGRSFELQGDLGLQLLPCCSVSLGPSRLGSPAGFAGEAFASLESAALSVKLWPLLTRREVEIGTVTLRGLALNLVTQADGTVNWEFDSAETGADAPPDDPGSAPLGLSVERIVLRDGEIGYRDLAAGQTYRVRELELDTQLAMAGDRVTITGPRLSLVASGTGLPDDVAMDVTADTVVASVADDAEVSVDAFTVAVRAADARLRLTGGGRAGAELALNGDFALDETSPRALLAALSDEPYEPAGATAMTRLAAQGRWTLSTSSLAVQDLALQLDDSSLTGSFAVDDFETAASRFDLSLDRIDVDPYLSTAPAGAAAPADAAGPTEIPLGALADVPVEGRLRIGAVTASGVTVRDVDAALQSQGGRLSTRLSATGLGGSLALDGSGDVAGRQPEIAGTLTVGDMSPRTLLEALDAAVDTADPNVLRRFAGSTRWRLTPQSAAFDDMRWQLDDSTLRGSARITDFDALATRFDVTLDRLDVDAYLPPEEDTAEETAEEADIVPVEAIRGLDLDGRLRAGELVVLGMTLRDVAAQVGAAGGVLRLEPLTAALYGGQYRGRIVVDATGPQADLTLDQELAAVQVNEILRGFFDTDVLAGALSFKLAGSGTGNTATDLLRGLAADVSFDLSDGEYRGVDVLYQLQRARALFRKEPAPEAPADQITPIRTLKMSGRMADGVLQTNRLTAETDALRLVGNGGINLLELALDYDLNAQVLDSAPASARLGDLANATIPLTLKGPVLSPRVGVDLKGMITSTVRETVQQKARQALLERLGGGQAPDGGGAATAADPGAQATPEAAAAPAETEPASEPAAETRPAEKPSTRDLLKRGLRELLKPPPEEEEAEPDGASG